MALPDDETLLLHNPRCSKSRQTKALLEERGVAFRERLYLDEPLDRAELLELAERLGTGVRDFTRTKESAFAERDLADADDDALAAAMAEEPILMERPILVRGARAALGRPPEKVLELL